MDKDVLQVLETNDRLLKMPKESKEATYKRSLENTKNRKNK